MNLKILRNNNLLLLMLCQFISLIGSNMQSFALSLYVLKTTGSTTKFASVVAITLIPNIVLGPLAGVFVDRFDRKKIIIILDLLSFSVISIVATVYKINNELPISYIYILVILLSMVSILYSPAISTIIPAIVEKEKLMEANSTKSLIMSLGSFLSPILAGLLLSFGNIFFIFLINALSFLIASIIEIFIEIPKLKKKLQPLGFKTFKNDFLEGISFIKDKKIIKSIMSLGVVVNLLYTPIMTICLIFICKNVYKVTDKQYGVFQSVLIVATLIAPIVVTRFKKREIGELYTLNMFITALMLFLIAIVSSEFYIGLFSGNVIPFLSLMLVTFLMVIVITIGNISLNTLMQKEVPLDLMGRVYTVIGTCCMCAIPLGQMFYGYILNSVPVYLCIGVSAVMLAVWVLVLKGSLCKKEEIILPKEDYDIKEDILINVPEGSNLLEEKVAIED